jgi:hypothetical protein
LNSPAFAAIFELLAEKTMKNIGKSSFFLADEILNNLGDQGLQDGAKISADL